MAYYAALVSVVQLLKEIIHPQHPYSNTLLPKKNKIHVSLYESFKLVQELLKDYSPKDESADILEGRIRDAAYHALNSIESQISNHILQRDIEEEPACFLERGIKEGARRTRDIIGTHISNRELKKVKEEVGSILGQLMRIKMEKVTIHGDNLQGTYYSANSDGASTQATRIAGVGGAEKVQDRSGRSTTVVLDEHLITTIKGQICGEPSSRAVISIVGMGGLGKTTLAEIIFDDKLIHDRFDCCAWVTTSQNYHRINIFLTIVDSLNMEKKEELKKAEVGVLGEQIYKHLKGRRYIIVVDDVWETKIWDDLNRIFPNDHNGSRVIVTTRLLNVAVYADNSGFIHELQFLNEYQSWNLFREKVFCPNELEDIGRLIAKNCQGLPLAIVVVAGILSKVNKTRRDWEEIARDVSLATIGQNDERFSKILSLSYNHLPHHLKSCFLFLGCFPEDYDIRVSELIWLWIAQGLLQPIADKSLEEAGNEYLNDLVKRNLVLITEKKSCGKLKKCGIHDLLRDLCLQRACFERFFLCVHRFSIHMSIDMWRGSLFQYIFKKKYISRLRSILFFAEDYDLSILSPEFSFELLRVLDKRFVSGFHEEVGKLLHMRYLALREYRISFSPSILFKLQNLQTLIVGPDSSLPSDIWKKPQLRHVKGMRLIFPRIPYDEIMIIDGVPLLGNLQTLETIRNFRFTRDTVEMIPNLKKLKVEYINGESVRTWEEFQLNNLVHLRQLEVLSIHVINLQDIESPENFVFPSTLIKLTLLGCRLPWKHISAVGSLPNLQVLKLQRNSFAGKVWEPAEGEFPKLKSLLLSELWDLKYWRAEDVHFPSLEKLRIEICTDLVEIPLGIGDISTLESIVVKHCNSDLESSALKIQEEQQDLGNFDLQVRVIRARMWLEFARYGLGFSPRKFFRDKNLI